MLHVDLIAPIATLLERHAKTTPGPGGVLGFVALGHLRATSPGGPLRSRPT